MQANKKAIIDALLSENLYLSESIRTEIYQNLPNLTSAQIENLINALENANQEQRNAMPTVLENNPHFFKGLESKVAISMRQEHEAIENKEKANSEALLNKSLKTL